MNSITKIACGVALGSVVLLGCDDRKPAKPAASPPTTQNVSAKAGSVATTLPTTAPAIPTTQTPEPLVVKPPASKDVEQAKQAQDLLGQAIQAIKDTRLEDAKAALDKVEPMKSSLPETAQEQLKTVRGNLEKVEKLQKPELRPTTDAVNK